MKITYYLEVLSSWCTWAEPTWDALKARYAGSVSFEWRIALMNPEDFPISREQCDWYYRRSGGTVMRSPRMLNSGWFDASRKGVYHAPNLVAEAGRNFGIEGDELRRAIARAAVRDGQQVGEMAKAIAVGAAAVQIDPGELRKAAESPAVWSRVEARTREFFSHQINQRPAFVLTSSIGDKAVFSGLVHLEPLVATVDAMLSDTAAYASHAAHYGTKPD